DGNRRLFGDRLDGVGAGGRLFAVHQPPDTGDFGERVTVLGALSGGDGDGLGRSLHDDGQGVALPGLGAVAVQADQGHRVLAGGGRRAGDARAVPLLRLGGQVCRERVAGDVELNRAAAEQRGELDGPLFAGGDDRLGEGCVNGGHVVLSWGAPRHRGGSHGAGARSGCPSGLGGGVAVGDAGQGEDGRRVQRLGVV